jgi:hypothetical protein
MLNGIYSNVQSMAKYAEASAFANVLLLAGWLVGRMGHNFSTIVCNIVQLFLVHGPGSLCRCDGVVLPLGTVPFLTLNLGPMRL